MRLIVAIFAVFALATSASAQDATRQLTADDYARAERFLTDNTTPLVYRDLVQPQWTEDGRFWYRNRVPGGSEFVMVDPESGQKGRAFDHARMATVLSAASGTVLSALELPVEDLTFSDNVVIVEMEGGLLYRCAMTNYTCAETRPARPPVSPSEMVSPDGRTVAFIRSHNLWVRDRDTGAETQLTLDGVEDFGYGTNNAGWVRRDRPVLKWSPDSRKIATFQHDGRGVGMMYLATTKVGHPELDAWRYPMPEDTVIFRVHRVVVDLDRPAGDHMVRLAMEVDQHRSTCSDHIECGGVLGDLEWSADGSHFAFVSSSRDHKVARVRIADASTGVVRDVFEEVEETFYESQSGWRYLSASNEILWFSQRDNWGNLFLYDATTGAVKRKVTEGDWNVLDIRGVDEEGRSVTFMGSEREAGDPYFQYLYRVGLDNGRVELLTPDSAHHTVSISPDGRHIVDSYSTPLIPPVTVLRSTNGSVRTVLEEADVSRLTASGWQPPMPFSVKARDGETDLYGLLFRPLDFDPNSKYPVVNYLYPGPQSGSVGSRSFRASHRDLQAIAELGFVVIELDAMGTPGRSKAFHEAYYGNMGDNGLPDQMGGIRQLADRHAWIDLERVGIFGHSGGGFAAADAIMRYPDFYDVAVSQAGNHDNRNYEDDWGEKWQGLLVVAPDGSTNYDNQANQLLATNLRGKLLIAHGTMDTNVPPSNTMLVVNALIEANKDFDLLMLPNRGHGFGNEPYMMRRRWDYFVRNLLGAEPPQGYEIGRMTRPVG
ncbi:MAG: DPP IV N-terminal domain-containing protein [Gemmatimonadetes bacterium]|nr:DPP IV N-terminal domain-containing protein [Gemmatimonadota bacterium]MDA1104437.1 DPP IV N-terminal domain-containing protein [Gemmatimonadota bacterium]